ncbi:cysteine/serine-rich nuclear protein 1b [Hypomesus transpacificus]|uniref:cysteine/serine-rich nuclear protein 1b n=1 Tax=Hypomesus transpacificus TaxID=137520 RepID=UPI001F0827DC|nr:cysteine/serine-rich nuclear protein 1b [Hypomesus transpacificus]XP_046879414.1 cysteine/serine-rich nuclear protein 1b [Hypomesus transpacificus]XP_046879415.1 cysteine/serine-rich nuclear protein 1b [Hypomesus transpacificus]XP_046879417.1 cysteine/serine-rich nuclear protein 1b [Hypomesus transpacificus]XP_046879418.1 cysteine/serine-rich nuclear protein 1b [Hypomesus transpacificus]XP_046879419.1 cysteine/serine-rich nuclear protein 1b [Hypomesus transpacificus]
MLAAMSGLILKRKYEEVEDDPCYSSPSSLSSSAYSCWDSESESCDSDTLDSPPSNPSSPATHFHTTSILKKAKRMRRERGTNVTFDQVTVFFFQHCQGFISVPSRGGCSLGMMQRHSALRTYTLAEFAAEQIVLRRKKLLDRLREEKLEALKLKLTKNGTQESEEAEHLTVDDFPEEELDLDLGTAGACQDNGSFLHPYSSKRRHILLKAAGVKKIDKEEKRQLHELRVSREDCGCNCQGFCEPETCGCSLAGIKCQMDHSSFPCGCTKEGCGNTEGRIEFNSSRVQTHYIHTIMKLELEKRLEEHSGPEEEEGEGKLEVNGFQLDCSNHGYGNSCKLLGLPPQADHSCLTVSLPTGTSFHFSTELAAGGENSCSSDMTDSSSGSSAHEDSEAGERSTGEECFPLGVDESSLSRILRFSNAYNKDCTVNCRGVTNCLNNNCHEKQQALQQSSLFGGFSSAEFPDKNENFDAALLDSTDDHMGSRAATISELLDENANQGNGLFHSGSVPRTPSPSFDQSVSYGMDLSLSSESDLEFFYGFPCLGPSSLYSSLKEYEHMDNFFQSQMPSYPSLLQASDPVTCLLESLVGLSESVPEPPATFTDNQLLEEAFKLSVMESVKG